MSIIMILLIGGISIYLSTLSRRPLLDKVGKGNLYMKLERANWYRNPWLAGGFLFLVNATLFLLTIAILFLILDLMIPYFHFIIMFLAVAASIYSWSILNRAWNGIKIHRFVMGLVGSSFYLFSTGVFVYWYATLEPQFPGDDTFMAALGLMMAMIVTTVAAITCLIFTGFRKN